MSTGSGAWWYIHQEKSLLTNTWAVWSVLLLFFTSLPLTELFCWYDPQAEWGWRRKRTRSNANWRGQRQEMQELVQRCDLCVNILKSVVFACMFPSLCTVCVVGVSGHALDISALLRAMASSRSSCSCCLSLFSRSRSARSLSRLAHSNCWASFPNYRDRGREGERIS